MQATSAADPATAPRLFLALWPDDPVRAAIVRTQARLVLAPSSRMVDARRLHLTLHFIGAVPAMRLPALRAALGLPARPCTLQLDRLEAWPHGLLVWRASVVPPALADLHRHLALALRALELPVERRPFRPHVTLARRAELQAPLPPAPVLDWPLHAHVLVRSTPQGAYEPLAEWRWPGATCRT